MNCCFENTLHYSSPGHGDWGVVRIGMLLPESVQLFVCPSACGRHGAIGAMRQGLKDRLFYLYVDQKDIVDGYDDLIPHAVEEVLAVLKKRPRAFYIFVSCLDDLLGTDHEALREKLGKMHPDIHFLTGHMNPISLGSKTPPPVSIQNNLYCGLAWNGAKDACVNSIGNLTAVAQSSELYGFLEACGVPALRHISQYSTYDGYLEMGKSRANLVLGAAGRQAAEQMEERIGTPCLFLPATYLPEEIEENYRKLGAFLGCQGEPDFDLAACRRQAEEAVKEARTAVGALPIVIDATAVAQPFGLAKALLSWGFSVVRVECQECPAFDKGHLAWLEEYHPEVEIFQTEHHRAVLFDRRLPESLALGVEGAYLAGSRYVADLFNDEGNFGYDGIVRLMKILAAGAAAPTDLESLIGSYGLVV